MLGGSEPPSMLTPTYASFVVPGIYGETLGMRSGTFLR